MATQKKIAKTIRNHKQYGRQTLLLTMCGTIKDQVLLQQFTI